MVDKRYYGRSAATQVHGLPSVWLLATFLSVSERWAAIANVQAVSARQIIECCLACDDVEHVWRLYQLPRGVGFVLRLAGLHVAAPLKQPLDTGGVIARRGLCILVLVCVLQWW